MHRFDERFMGFREQLTVTHRVKVFLGNSFMKFRGIYLRAPGCFFRGPNAWRSPGLWFGCSTLSHPHGCNKLSPVGLCGVLVVADERVVRKCNNPPHSGSVRKAQNSVLKAYVS